MSTKIRNPRGRHAPRFVVCIENTGYPASLELHKIYVQRRAREAYQRFKENPQHRSLRFKRVHATRPILATTESDRLGAVRRYHQGVKHAAGNPRLHAAIHVVVETQLAEGHPAAIDAMNRLIANGASEEVFAWRGRQPEEI